MATLLAELRKRKHTLGFGESCTGGLLSAVLTSVPSVSDTYLGAVVSYSNAAKTHLLGVSPETLNRVGAVSEEVAGEMAAGVCKQLSVTWGIAVTGIAGPAGGTPEKPVGTVCFGFRGPGVSRTTRKLLTGNRDAIQRQTVECAIEMLITIVRETPVE
ncbi:MAG: damage-inducible protein CinA [Bdellovibrio sp.]|nr:MAG: damage-inducible protein CinA [Bdellovibrio sp.]